MQSNHPHQRNKQSTIPPPFRGPENSFGSSVGTDSSQGRTFNAAGGFGQESESAIEADASTIDEDSDYTTMQSGSNNQLKSTFLENTPMFAKGERRSLKHINATLAERAITSVDSDASLSPTFEKSTFSGSHSHFNVDSRKPVATDIPTPSSGYQADTEIPENEESHTTTNSHQHQHHHQHQQHAQNYYSSSSMEYNRNDDTDI